MSKKTLVLIIFLFLVTCGLLYLAVVTPPYQQPALVGPTPTPISVNAHTTLSLGPASASESSKLAQYNIAVTMNTNSNKVNAVQLELAYDPQALTNVTVTPGDFFTQPNTLLNNIDTVDGRISYATTEQVSLPSKMGIGTVAIISFDIAKDFTGKTTTISFLPKSAVAAERIMESVLRQMTNYTINIPTAAPMQPVSTTSAQ